MLWNTKNEIPIGRGKRKRKSMGATPAKLADAGSTNRNLYLKNASSARLKAMPIGNHIGRYRKVKSKADRFRKRRRPEAAEVRAAHNRKRTSSRQPATGSEAF